MNSELVFKIILAGHIATGTLGLILGPIAMFARKAKGLHTKVGAVYHWNMLAVCVAGAALAVLHWEKSKYFLAVAAFSYANALKGYLAARANPRKPDWLRDHISGMGGSYIALVTALVVVNRDNLPVIRDMAWYVPWIIPTLVGSPIIRLTVSKWVRTPARAA